MSVAEFRPDLVPYWLDRNDKTPYEVARGSGYKAWWTAPCRHEWQARADNRCYNNTGCPYCTPGSGGRQLLSGVNDLATRFPEIAAEWHPTRNGDLTPSDVLPGSRTRVWWLCLACSREWERDLKGRTAKGSGCPSCRGRKRGIAVSGTQHSETVLREWSPRNTSAPSDHSVNSNHKAWWVCDKGHEWQALVIDRNVKGSGCEACGGSKGEDDFAKFVLSLAPTAKRHVRDLAPGFEYDVVVADKKVALEYNGLYWHSEKIKPGSDYHLRKTRAAENAGYSLVHVWEDDWRDKRPVVEAMIRRKLGVSEEPRHNARSLRVQKISAPEARAFLDAHHIQGFASGSWYGALVSEVGPVAVLVMKRRGEDEWELARFATSAIVRGGHTKLLTAFRREHDPARIVTFSDNTVSSGGLYENSGFRRDGELPPDYTYLVKGSRAHKFNYRKARFQKDDALEYREGLSERQLAELNGLLRVYDAGKVRWVL